MAVYLGGSTHPELDSQFFRIELSLYLFGYSILVFGRAFEQQVIGVKCAVFAQASSHDGLSFVLQQVRFGADIYYFDPFAGGICHSFVKYGTQTTLGINLIIVTRDVGDLKCDGEGFEIILNAITDHRSGYA